jgi:hypothetical protein
MLERIVGRVVQCTHWDFPREGSHGIDKANKALQKPITHHLGALNLIAKKLFSTTIFPFSPTGLWPVLSAISKALRDRRRPHHALASPAQAPVSAKSRQALS